MATTQVLEQEQELTPERLIEDYKTLKRARQHSSMASANWVTVLAHECEAYAVFNRTVPPNERRPLKESLGMLFAEGNDQARAIKRDLLDAGYEVEGAEDQMAWPRYQITGRQDLKIRRPGTKRGVNAEIKSCSPFTFDSINSVADLRHHKWSFVRKWDRQVCLYMVLQSVSRYWLILKNKSTGAIKIIEYTLGDEELQVAEALIGKAERVNRLVQIAQMPGAEQKLSDPDVCGECEFLHVCLPEMEFGPGAKVLTEESASELAQKTERLLELRPLAKEYEALDDELKEEVKALCADGSEQVVYGDYVATVKRIQVNGSPEKVVPAKPGYVQQRVTFIRAAAP